MDVVVDLVTAGVALHQPEVLTSFAVRVLPGQEGDGAGTEALGAVAAALSVHDAGWIDPAGVAFIPTESVRRLAALAAEAAGQPLGDAWDDNFAAMLEYAATLGWISEGGAIQAHIEWAGP